MPRSDVVTVGRPVMPEPARVAELLQEAIGEGWLTNGGVLHRRLERGIAPHIGCESVRLVSSGTTALMMALHLGDLPPGAEVITTPLSFAATVQAINWCGLKPVFADIDPETLNLCPKSVKAAISSRTAAILPVHFMGTPCDVEQFSKLAEMHGLWLAYDGAHAFGVELYDRPIGRWGDATAFSLHATKLMHTGEGGVLATSRGNDTTVNKMRKFGLQQGRIRQIGTNAKLSEAQAAVGLSVLEQLDEEISARRRLRKLYDDALGNLPHLVTPKPVSGATDNLIYYPLRMQPALREKMVLECAKDMIFLRDHFPILCGAGTMFADAKIVSTHADPIAPELAPGLLALPFHSKVTIRDVERIARIAAAL